MNRKNGNRPNVDMPVSSHADDGEIITVGSRRLRRVFA